MNTTDPASKSDISDTSRLSPRQVSDIAGALVIAVFELTISGPSAIVVVPDVIEKALTSTMLPTNFPKIEHGTYTAGGGGHVHGKTGTLTFHGAGANLRNVLKLIAIFDEEMTPHCIRVDRATSTDIRDIEAVLGIEAANAALKKEFVNLFSKYDVDPRHLSLAADAATRSGRWVAFNFTGIIKESSSPLFQMTFASSRRFLHTAITRGVPDNLKSLSAAIMVGEAPAVGTATVKAEVLPSVLFRPFATTPRHAVKDDEDEDGGGGGGDAGGGHRRNAAADDEPKARVVGGALKQERQTTQAGGTSSHRKESRKKAHHQAADEEPHEEPAASGRTAVTPAKTPPAAERSPILGKVVEKTSSALKPMQRKALAML